MRFASVCDLIMRFKSVISNLLINNKTVIICEIINNEAVAIQDNIIVDDIYSRKEKSFIITIFSCGCFSM